MQQGLERAGGQDRNLVRDFGRIAKWFPSISESVLRDGAASTQIGAIRDNTDQEGQVISEQLVAFSEREPNFTYDLTSGDVPMTNYTYT